MVSPREKKVRKLVDFCNGLQEPETVITWDSTVERYALIAEKFNNILSQPEFQGSPEVGGMKKRLEALVDRCVNSEFQIAFVGTIKAGKSTLINAILGQNIASTRVTPETAVLTKFRSSAENYIKVKFYTAEEWEELWKTISNRADVFLEEYATLDGENHKSTWVGHEEYSVSVSGDEMKEELERWSSSKHVEHYFVKEIEVGLTNLDLPENVVFVDTPGLGDPVKYRSDVTRKYIDRANAVFVCTTAHAMTNEETRSIYGVFSNSSSKEKIFIIGTQVDNLNTPPEEDWAEQKSEWKKYLSEAAAFGSAGLAESNIIPSAAYIENLCREYINGKTDKSENNAIFSLITKYQIYTTEDMMKGIAFNMEECVRRLREYSHIGEIIGRIRNDILSKYKEYLIQDIVKIYTDLKEDMKKFFYEVAMKNRNLLDASAGDLTEIRAEYEKAKENANKSKNVKKKLEMMLDVLKEDNRKRLRNLEEMLKKAY